MCKDWKEFELTRDQPNKFLLNPPQLRNKQKGNKDERRQV
jgi:hypothetical protein